MDDSSNLRNIVKVEADQHPLSGRFARLSRLIREAEKEINS